MKNHSKPYKKIHLWVFVGLIILAGLLLQYMFEEIKYVKTIHEIKKTNYDIFSRQK